MPVSPVIDNAIIASARGKDIRDIRYNISRHSNGYIIVSIAWFNKKGLLKSKTLVLNSDQAAQLKLALGS